MTSQSKDSKLQGDTQRYPLVCESQHARKEFSGFHVVSSMWWTRAKLTILKVYTIYRVCNAMPEKSEI
jgi:hypothetical protein